MHLTDKGRAYMWGFARKSEAVAMRDGLLKLEHKAKVKLWRGVVTWEKVQE